MWVCQREVGVALHEQVICIMFIKLQTQKNLEHNYHKTKCHTTQLRRVTAGKFRGMPYKIYIISKCVLGRIC